MLLHITPQSRPSRPPGFLSALVHGTRALLLGGPVARADRRSGLRPIACAPGHQPGVQYIRPFQGRKQAPDALATLAVAYAVAGGPLRLRNGDGLAAPWAAFPFRSICHWQMVSFVVRRILDRKNLRRNAPELLTRKIQCVLQPVRSGQRSKIF